jgi:hypothetical protein
MDLHCNAYRLERTQLDVRFAGVNYQYARASFQKTLRFCRLTELILYEDFTAGADRLEVHDTPGAHLYRQNGRDRLVTSI